MPFNLALKRLRLERNLSQSELAKAIDISKSAVAMYETGKREPNFETLEAFADYFNVDMNILMDTAPSPTAPIELTPHEEMHIKKYRHLSDGGRQNVDDFTDFQLLKEKNATQSAEDVKSA